MHLPQRQLAQKLLMMLFWALLIQSSLMAAVLSAMAGPVSPQHLPLWQISGQMLGQKVFMQVLQSKASSVNSLQKVQGGQQML